MKNQKTYVSETNFDFDGIFWKMFDEILIDFDAKLDLLFNQI